MKRVLSFVLVFAMMLSLAACSGGNDTSSTGSTNAGSSSSTTAEPASNQIIFGSTTELSGDLGNAWWTNNVADMDIRTLIDDYDVITTDQEGAFVENATVCGGVESVENEDGTKTFTVKINEGLMYNNGDPITAADYVAYALIAYSPAAKEAGAKNSAGAATVVGATEYMNGEADTISGIHLVDEYTYSITISADYLPYYFDMTYASLKPLSLKLYASDELTVKDDGEGVYLDGGELKADEIDASRYVYEGRISACPYQLV